MGYDAYGDNDDWDVIVDNHKLCVSQGENGKDFQMLFVPVSKEKTDKAYFESLPHFVFSFLLPSLFGRMPYRAGDAGCALSDCCKFSLFVNLIRFWFNVKIGCIKRASFHQSVRRIPEATGNAFSMGKNTALKNFLNKIKNSCKNMIVMFENMTRQTCHVHFLKHDKEFVMFRAKT